MEQAIFLSLMRLREKMSAVKALPSGASGNGDGGDKTSSTALLKDSSRRGRRDGNLGDYTRTLWSSLGGDTAASADQQTGSGSAAAAGGAAGGVGGARGGGAGDGIDVRPGGRGGQRLYWAGGENSNHVRLVAFAETLAAGESALSPGVFEVEGGRRAEVCRIFFWGGYLWKHVLVSASTIRIFRCAAETGKV